MRLLFVSPAAAGSAMVSAALSTIGRTLGGCRRTPPPAKFPDWRKGNNGFVARAIPFVVLRSLLGLVGSLWLDWRDGQARASWLGAIVAVIAVSSPAAAAFAPTNARFAAESIAR